MSRIIGIDLGTSTTEAAVFVDGKPQMIRNFDNEIVTPSAVGVDKNGSWVAGARAAAQYLLMPEKTAIEIKRKIGTEERFSIGKRSYSAVELSAKLLEYVRDYASEELGEDITRAVISVPAYFNDTQRKETIYAARLCGLDVERIINEPTAAALSYGLEHLEEESHILVYDLGGGTFDVTLLEMFDGVLDVKASAGDNQLGGKDFDERLIEELLQRFEKKNGVSPRNNRRAMSRIRREAEKCKITLSAKTECRILLAALMDGKNGPLAMEEVVTRAEFEELTKDLIARTHHPIDVVLKDARLSAAELDRIILVGGSTRMPAVRADLAAYLKKEPEAAVDPDFAVAQGAAIQAALLEGQLDSEAGDLMITDVNPYTLGVRCSDGYDDHNIMSVIIPRNVTIPVSRTNRYWTMHPGQTQIKVEIYQGESSRASENHFLGQYMLEGIPYNPIATEEVEITFTYDVNGILETQAKCVSNGQAASMRIDMMKDTPDLDN
ncbi:MAG: Hsp70 family protein [Solobacterium sp.]|nr:Hsp70 family protein [Solobacterium sp.]